ncbi:MAG: hypothetical protein AVDCRST_MAG67-1490, partial [uncultured Solirubrobacteraceae bacterium]
ASSLGIRGGGLRVSAARPGCLRRRRAAGLRAEGRVL